MHTAWLWLASLGLGLGLERPDVEYRIYQFPPHAIPRIDGDPADWERVPDSYAIRTDQLRETVRGLGDRHDRKSLDVSVKVGWVKGLNQLYFLYEATDDYWDFSRPDLHNDIFEVVVDGDLSGGPLIRQLHPQKELRDRLSTHFDFHGIHAQNYHIFTPAEGKDWAMVWGCQPWIRELPWANSATRCSARPGQGGTLVLEFFITPFDHAPADESRAIPTRLKENQRIGLSWAILDYDDVGAETYAGFWNLSHKTTMYGDASDLVAFRLMPPERHDAPGLRADWGFAVVDPDLRRVAFRDRSSGEVTGWKWLFGDGEESVERHPVHTYREPGEYIVILEVTGPSGKSRRSRIWDVTLP